MGHGGFGEVVAFTWHGQQAAYKVVPVFGNTKLELEKQKKLKREEFDFQRHCSVKPLDKKSLKSYEQLCPGAEKHVLKPLGCFFFEQSGNVYFVMVTPECQFDLERFKERVKMSQ